jgi:HK97 family phage portal protein
VAVLDQKTSFQPISISPEDAETLATRSFQVEEIAGRIFGVPPFMVGATDKSTSWGTGLAEQKDGYVTFTLLPRMAAWEFAIKRQLLLPKERKTLFAGFVMEGILRASIEKRYAAYQVARNGGWISANEIRKLDNMNPLPAEIGDVYWRPANMMDAGQKISPQQTTVANDRAESLGIGGNGNGHRR